jgi:hypothetical protein
LVRVTGQGRQYEPWSAHFCSNPQKKGYGCEIVNPISGERYKFVGYTFVDDTDLVESKVGCWDLPTIVSGMQDALDTWEGSLKATCGVIAPKKTFWYLVSFEWKAGQWKYSSIQDTHANLYVFALEGNQCLIKRYET